MTPSKLKRTKYSAKSIYAAPNANRGWIKTDRGWRDDPFFCSEHFSSYDIWGWMVEQAVFLDEGITIYPAGNPVHLNRGEFSYSIRFMANAFGWTKTRVENFLKKARKAGKIRTCTRTGQLIISVCNYDQFRAEESKYGTAYRTEARHFADSSRTNNKNDNKDKNDNKEETSGYSAIKELEPWKAPLKKLLSENDFNTFIAPLSLDSDGYVVIDPNKVGLFGVCMQRFEQEIRDSIVKCGQSYSGPKHPFLGYNPTLASRSLTDK